MAGAVNQFPIYFIQGSAAQGSAAIACMRDVFNYPDRNIEGCVGSQGAVRNMDILSNAFFTDIPLQIQLKTMSNNYNIELYDFNGNVVYGGTPNTAYTTVINQTIPKNQYILNFWHSGIANLNNNDRIWDIKAIATRQVSIYFNIPWTLIPQDPKITMATGAYGGVTVNFTNFTVTTGQVIDLVAMNGLMRTAALTIVTSDATVFAYGTSTVNYNTAVYPQPLYVYSVVALKNTTFTGAVTITITNEGTTFTAGLIVKHVFPSIGINN